MEAYTRTRAGKRLLVAALGVATVSYVGTQSGCAADGATSDEESSEQVAPYDDEEPAIEGTEQALHTGTILIVEKIKIKDPRPVGNLMGPPIKVIRDFEAIAVKQVK